MGKSESYSNLTQEKLYFIVVSGKSGARQAFDTLAGLANGGDKTSRRLMDLLDEAIQSKEIPSPLDQPETPEQQGLVDQLASLYPDPKTLSPDKF